MASFQTEEQKRLAEEAAQQFSFGTVAGGKEFLNTITGDDLTPAPVPEFRPAPETSVFPVETLEFQQPAPALETPEADKSTGFVKEFEDITKRLEELPSFRHRKEEEFEIPKLEEEFGKLGLQLRELQKEQAAIPISIQQRFEGRGATRSGVAPIETAELRRNALEALQVSALIDAANLNLINAQRKVGRAVQQEFDDAIAKKEAILENIDILQKSGALSREEQKRAEFQKGQQESELNALKQRREQKENILNIANQYSIEARKGGIYNSTIAQQIQRSRSLEEAMNLRDTELAKIEPEEVGDLRTERIGGFRVLRDSTGKVISSRAMSEEPTRITVPRFSSTQQNKGAAIAGVSFEEFASFVPDVQNYYVNLSTTDTKNLKDSLTNVKSGSLRLEEAIEYIESRGVSPEVETHLKELFTKAAEGVDQRSGFQRTWDAIKNFFR